MHDEQQFEKLLNIKTIGEQYGFPKLAHYHRYEPTPYSGLEQLFAQYKLPEKACWIDMGCGKGRVPIYVHHRFAIAVKGIEMDAIYIEQAKRNKGSYLQGRKRQEESITFLHMLAQHYEVTVVDNVFFFFNPFSVSIFRKVVQRIVQSFEKQPRMIDIILYYPLHDYLQLLTYETAFELLLDIPLSNTNDLNERICVFRMKVDEAFSYE